VLLASALLLACSVLMLGSGHPVFATTTASDDFTRADSSSSIGGSWAGATTSYGIAGNTAYPSLTTTAEANVTLGTVLDGWVQAKLSALPATTEQVGLWGRFDGAANGYWGGVTAATSCAAGQRQVALLKRVASVTTTFNTSCTALAAGDVLRLTLAASDVSVSVNGSVRLAVTDSALTASGSAGVYSQKSNTGARSLRLDDFTVDDGVVATTTTTAAPTTTTTAAPTTTTTAAEHVCRTTTTSAGSTTSAPECVSRVEIEGVNYDDLGVLFAVIALTCGVLVGTRLIGGPR
jgi:hypothetical protein